MVDDRDETDWTAAERAAFDALPRGSEPPDALEQRVVDELRRRGHIRSGQGRRRIRILAIVAAASILFVLGVASERWLFRSADPAVDTGRGRERATHMLLLYHSPESLRQSQETSQAAEYASWARTNRAVVGGEELADAGRWLAPRGNPPRTIGEQTLVGYFLVEADDDAVARAIAEECPHLDYGSIEVRRVQRR